MCQLDSGLALEGKKPKNVLVVNDSDLRKLHENITNHTHTVIFQLHSSVSKGICIFFSVFGLYVVRGMVLTRVHIIHIELD